MMREFYYRPRHRTLQFIYHCREETDLPTQFPNAWMFQFSRWDETCGHGRAKHLQSVHFRKRRSVGDNASFSRDFFSCLSEGKRPVPTKTFHCFVSTLPRALRSHSIESCHGKNGLYINSTKARMQTFYH